MWNWFDASDQHVAEGSSHSHHLVGVAKPVVPLDGRGPSVALLFKVDFRLAVETGNVRPAVPDLGGHPIGIGKQCVAGVLSGVHADRFHPGAAERLRHPNRMLTIDKPGRERPTASLAGLHKLETAEFAAF